MRRLLLISICLLGVIALKHYELELEKKEYFDYEKDLEYYNK